MNLAVGENLLELVYRHSIRTLMPGLVVVVFLGYFLSVNTVGSAWFVWTLVAAFLHVARPVGLKNIVKSITLSMKTRLTLAGINTVIYGASIGSVVLFFPQLDLAERLIVTLVILGASGVASTINAGYTVFYLCYVIPLLAPTVVSWMVDTGNHLSLSVSLSIGFLAIMKVALTTVMGRINFGMFSSFIQLSNQQRLMSAELSDALSIAEREQQSAVASNVSKTRFLAAASHDLRQPVHVVSLFGSALETMVEEDEVKEVVGDMNSAVRSLSKQLNELLDIAKLDSEIVEPDIRQLELNNVVGSVVDEIRPEAVAADIVLLNSVEDGVYVYSDTSMLSQILRNVIGNAIKYTGSGSITLSANTEHDAVILSVEDTGIGMSEEEQTHIFEEFFQINNPERSRQKGIGLGLSIVKRLARALSHDITITSEPGKGTCVSLSMKACKSLQADAFKPALLDVQENEIARFDCWVHIVDDEPSVRKSMSTLLEELGCVATASASTIETVEFMELSRPDIFMVDLRLQGDDSGISTLNAIEKIYPNVHRVMITGEKYLRLDEDGLNGDVTVLHKPVSKQQIITLLKSLLGSRLSRTVTYTAN